MRYPYAVSLCGWLVLPLVGCASNPSTNPDGGPRPDASVSVNVTGTSIATYLLDSGNKTKPSDLTTATIAALVPISTGGFTTITGQGKADGTFSIPNVPMGTYYLQVSSGFLTNSYTITSARVIDLGSQALGRPDVTATALSTTTFSPALSGLLPWGASDHIELLAANANAFAYDITDQATAKRPLAGATSINGARLVYQNYFFPPNIIDSSKGDQTYLYQLSTKVNASLASYTTLTKSLLLPSLTLLEGQDNSIQGTLADVPQTNSISAHVGATQFASIAVAGNAKAVVSTHATLYLESQPGGLGYGDFSASADLLEYNFNPAAADQDTGVLAYGNPFPTSWGTYGRVSVDYSVPYTVPGAVNPMNVAGLVTYAADKTTLASGIAPLIGPAQNVKINGMAATSDLTGITATPTITFDPPTLGTATSYVVSLLEVTITNGTPRARTAAQFRTQGTSVTVPPGILMSGTYYVCSITASYAPQDTFSAPNQRHFPQGSATSISGLLQP